MRERTARSTAFIGDLEYRSSASTSCKRLASGSTVATPQPSDRSPLKRACCRVRMVPALFTRGETQALVAATLGTSMDEQRIDSCMARSEKRFPAALQLPPFSVGETSYAAWPGPPRDRPRNAGRAGSCDEFCPTFDDFPYTIRIVCRHPGK
ncbi:MAG: hypothetical protein MZV70_73605 [Desulfobacterales bacterium]|nr:hypothetical protein [Desulfobacterales bacterium]